MNNLVYFSVNLQKRYALFPFQNNISFVEKICLLSFSSCTTYYFRSLDTANCKKAHQKFYSICTLSINFSVVFGRNLS